MVARRPVVTNDGLISELNQGDTVSTPFVTTTEVVAGSGLSGGGLVSGNVSVDVSLAPNPSGLIFVGDSLGINGAAQVLANAAVSSGNAAVFSATSALASGNNSLVSATAALASGNAALTVVPNINNTNLNQVTYTAASAVVSGYAVGVDGAGRVQSINRLTSNTVTPVTINPFVQAVTNRVPTLLPQSLSSSSTDNSFILVYSDNFNANYPTVKAGVISGTTSFLGSATVIESRSALKFAASCADGQNKHVVTYYMNSGRETKACVLAASGTSLFTGSPVRISSISGGVADLATACSTSKEKVVVLCTNFVSVSGILGTISGLSVSYGNPIYISPSSFDYTFPYIQYDQSIDKFITLAFSGFALSNGSPQVTLLSSSGSTLTRDIYQNLNLLPINLFSFSYGGLTLSSRSNTYVVSFPSGTRYVSFPLTLSGSTFTTGSYVVHGSGNGYYSSTFDPVSERTLLTEMTGGTIKSLSLSGSALVLDTPSTGVISYSSNLSDYMPITYNNFTNRCVTAYGQSSFSGRLNVLEPLRSYGYVPRNSVGPNILGVAQSTVASGSPCVVNLPGSIYTTPSGNFSTGAFYYADPTTSGLTTSAVPAPLWSGQTPWNYVGRAVSASGIMVLKTL
jgi:hypothetical protein